jgi:hypothetical protein
MISAKSKAFKSAVGHDGCGMCRMRNTTEGDSGHGEQSDDEIQFADASSHWILPFCGFFRTFSG